MSDVSELGSAVLDESGYRVLRDIAIRDQEFVSLELGGPRTAADVLQRVTMDHCRVSGGEFVIYSNVILQDVVLDTLNLYWRLNASCDAVFSGVVLRGQWVGGVWIGPSSVLSQAPLRSYDRPVNDTDLDVTDLRCDELTVLGLSAERVRWDYRHHVWMRLSESAAQLVREAKLERGSLCQIRISVMLRLGVRDGLFNVPLGVEQGRFESDLQRAMDHGLVHEVRE